MTIGRRISDSWERDGLVGTLQRSGLFFLRRFGWRTDAWSKSLDHRLTEQSILRKYGSLLKRN